MVYVSARIAVVTSTAARSKTSCLKWKIWRSWRVTTRSANATRDNPPTAHALKYRHHPHNHPSCTPSTLSRSLVSHPACVVQCVAQALTTLSVCFTVSDIELDASGLGDAIADFWENNPAVQVREPQPSAVLRGAGVCHTHTYSGCVRGR